MIININFSSVSEEIKKNQPNKPKGPSLFSLLKPYKGQITLLVFLTVVMNSFNLAIPKVIAKAIDSFSGGQLISNALILEFLLIAIFIAIFTYLQSIVQTYAAEKVAKDLRSEFVNKISMHEYQYIQEVTSGKLLTNLTSDVDAIKQFVAFAISSLISSIFLIIGASVLLLITDWKLGLAVLSVLPIIGGTFYFVFSKVKKLFKKAQEAIDWLNRVINESILGAALIRLLNSKQSEDDKFLAANTEAKNVGISILALFATLIPIITFVTNIATLIILTLGGHYVITGSISLGDFTAFNGYLAILIFPILILGFISNLIASAGVSYQRISEVLTAKEKVVSGKLTNKLNGDFAVKNVTVMYGEKAALKNISFSGKAGSKTAIIGPTAAGKTQLLYLMTELLQPTSGVVEYDGKNIKEYDAVSLHNQIGFVFQDSIIFNSTLRENIAFSKTVTDADLEKSIATAELKDFIDTLPNKLDTVVSERGTSLSGGQKQRVMLARALALNPRILLLDDFTSRVDTNTEQKILSNISNNYPDITLISVTQKISSIEKYDQVILLMEGELLASGKHDELMKSSTEYVQIYNSQQSTNAYELHA